MPPQRPGNRRASFLPPHLNGEERRIVHETLRDEDVDTKSDGVGRDRRLTIYPKGFLTE
jgi:predicted RNA-binding protein Jag